MTRFITIIESLRRVLGRCFSCSNFRDWFRKGFSTSFDLRAFRMNRDWLSAKTTLEFFPEVEIEFWFKNIFEEPKRDGGCKKLGIE